AVGAAVPAPRARRSVAARRPAGRPRGGRAARAPQNARPTIQGTAAGAPPEQWGGRSQARAKKAGKAEEMSTPGAQKSHIHPHKLRLYEREGLLKPSRTDGNARLYSEEDLEQLETILSLTRDLGVNLAGVEIILNMRRKIEQMQLEVNEFMEYVKKEMSRGLDDWEQRLSTALVKSSPTDLVKTQKQ